MSENKLPSDVDRVVGMRMRLRRRDLKLTEEQLGEQLGLSVAEESAPIPALPVMDMEAIELVNAFQKIEDKDLRKTLLATIRAAAASAEKATDS